MAASAVRPVIQVEGNDTMCPSPVDDDRQEMLPSSSSSSSESTTETLPNHRQIIFDKALGQMLTRHFYLVQHEFTSFDRFEGWVYTYNRHRYKVIISYHFSCSCQKFPRYHVCKHFLFVLKRIFHVNLHSTDLRCSIMHNHQFTIHDLDEIFQGQFRRLCPIVTPLLETEKIENPILTLKRQSIDNDDVCPICFERLLIKNRKLVTCFHSCGKSMHKNCMNQWKRVKGKSTSCPLCQALWINPLPTERAVLDHYSHRSNPVERHEHYILCCLYTPPE